jgi:hypothetical protein
MPQGIPLRPLEMAGRSIMHRVFVVLIFLLLPVNLSAYDNLCELAKDLPYTSFEQYQKTYNSSIFERSFDGQGYVINLYTDVLNGYFIFRMDCANDIFIIIATSSSTIGRSVKIGDRMSFSGKVTGEARKRYADTDRYYVEFSMQGSVE